MIQQISMMISIQMFSSLQVLIGRNISTDVLYFLNANSQHLYTKSYCFARGEPHEIRIYLLNL